MQFDKKVGKTARQFLAKSLYVHTDTAVYYVQF